MYINLTYTADSTGGAHLLFENTSLSLSWQIFLTLHSLSFSLSFIVLCSCKLCCFTFPAFFSWNCACALSADEFLCFLLLCSCFCGCVVVCCGYSFLSRRCTRSPSLPRAQAASHSGSSPRSEITMMMVMMMKLMLMMMIVCLFFGTSLPKCRAHLYACQLLLIS